VALQESINIECRLTGIRFTTMGDAKKTTPYVEGQWVAHVYNISRSAVTIASLTHDVTTINGRESTYGVEAVKDKHGAKYVDSDEDILIDARGSTSIYLTEYVPVSAAAMATKGVHEARSINDANMLLIPKLIDVFGSAMEVHEGIRSYKTDPAVSDWVNVYVTTSNKKVFSEKCYLSDGW
jgi:hypothetical protein